MDALFKFETLDTSYVSLAALIRHLREKEFTGRLHVVLDGYEADVFLYDSGAPNVWENDHSTGREAQGVAAMQRLLVRARDPGGTITVYEGTRVASAPSIENVGSTEEVSIETDDSYIAPDLASLIGASGQLIAAVERAVQTTGTNFAAHLHAVRIEIGDDYPFLDPTADGFVYADAEVNLQARPAGTSYVQALTECLKRVVNRVARQTEEIRFRERVAVELAVIARQQPECFSEFTSQLDRIAGTRVL